MSDRNVVDLIKLKEALSLIDSINDLPLDSIDWQIAGITVHVNKSEVDGFRFTGLSNTTFAKMAILEVD